MIDYRRNTLNLLNENGIDEIIFGRSERYRPIDLDFDTSVKPSCISTYIKDVMSDEEFLSIHSPDTALTKFATVISPILKMCIDFSKKKGSSIENKTLSQSFLDFYRKGGLAKWMVILELDRIKKTSDDILSAKEWSKDSKERCIRLLKILLFLEYIDAGLTFNSIIPESLYEQIKDFLKFGITILAKGYNTKVPSDLLDNIQYTNSEYPNIETEAFKITSIEGIRFYKKIFVMDGYEFKTDKDEKFIRDVLALKNDKLIRSVYFKNCYFNIEICPFFAGQVDLLFQDCRFEKCFGICGFFLKSMGFYRCSFLNKTNFLLGSVNYLYNLTLLECFFEKGSSCSIDAFPRDTGNSLAIYIENTLFNGELIISNKSEKKFDITMKNVSFGNQFKVKDINLSKSSIFENLTFSSIPSIQMDNARKDLYNAMKDAGLEERANELGIMPEIKNKKLTSDDREYHNALETGFLKSEYAAYFLNKSPSYLSKKRIKDKKQITRDSIPFVGEGKDILYPLDALQASQAKDWNTLKELRKKYKNEDN